MSKFTLDNTEGFSVSTLEKMNTEYELAIVDYDADEAGYKSVCDHIAENICDKYQG